MTKPDRSELDRLNEVLRKHEDASDNYVNSVYCNSEIRCPTCNDFIDGSVFSLNIEKEAIHTHYTCHKCDEEFELTYILSSMFKQSDGGLN